MEEASDQDPNLLLSSSSSNFVSVPYGIRVLVVDDDPTFLRVVEKMLSSYNYMVTTCESSIHALAILRKRKRDFDIVITDVHMPGMDGFELLERIDIETNLPVVMLSADKESDVIRRGLEHGACFYLTKPPSVDDLKNIWQYVISHRRRTQELTDENDKVESFENDNGDDDQCSNMALGFDSGDEMDNTSSVKGSCKKKQKARVIWHPALHERFLTAIHHLGFENAVPKKIHELMNVPGLSRQNVASHLQKYRLYLKRMAELQRNQKLASLSNSGANEQAHTGFPGGMQQAPANPMPNAHLTPMGFNPPPPVLPQTGAASNFKTPRYDQPVQDSQGNFQYMVPPPPLQPVVQHQGNISFNSSAVSTYITTGSSSRGRTSTAQMFNLPPAKFVAPDAYNPNLPAANFGGGGDFSGMGGNVGSRPRNYPNTPNYSGFQFANTQRFMEVSPGTGGGAAGVMQSNFNFDQMNQQNMNHVEASFSPVEASFSPVVFPEMTQQMQHGVAGDTGRDTGADPSENYRPENANHPTQFADIDMENLFLNEGEGEGASLLEFDYDLDDFQLIGAAALPPAPSKDGGFSLS